MSDSEPDLELLELLRQHIAGKPQVAAEPDTGVLESAEYVYNNSIDVALDMRSCKNAARAIYSQMQAKSYSPATWAAHELHPHPSKGDKPEDVVAFIFTMDLLNFCFWSERSEEERFSIEYKGRRWTGYWSLVAALQRALEEGIPITDPHFWQNEEELTLSTLKHVFRSATSEEMPLLAARLSCLREAGQILYEKFSCHPLHLVTSSNNSAARLVNTLASNFSCFNDTHSPPSFPRKKPIRLLKRAQILVADLWACFEGQGPYGKFYDIDKITMFADYRIPQMLNQLGCIQYSPPLETAVQLKRDIPSGSNWEIQLRACSIWCVELIRREILRENPGARVNAILIDFFLYDTIKETEDEGRERAPHHRTRSIWY
ncbi:Putative protein of unknown function [Podospora comata]|uniref:Queuosine 5'-phosphate N-glycosylase/hydrolase n=1 Tax=Podospora comata TaxID=48703 RepID=A0ABY6S6H7_PODCO|nr:Putative protein of unknown function [Podospora comata]